jgi:hypothetical protein
MDRQKIVNRVVILIAVIAVVFSAYFFYRWSLLRQNPQSVAQAEVADLVAKVGKLAVLPTGETPTVATVSDLAALKDQLFFAFAQKGDKVLIYAQAKKAILYSVLLNKIIDVAPLNIGTQTSITPPVTSDTNTPAQKKP